MLGTSWNYQTQTNLEHYINGLVSQLGWILLLVTLVLLGHAMTHDMISRNQLQVTLVFVEFKLPETCVWRNTLGLAPFLSVINFIVDAPILP